MLKKIEDRLLDCLEHKWGTAVVGLLCVGLVFPPWGYYLFRNTSDLYYNAWVVLYYHYIIDSVALPTVINDSNFLSLNVVPIFYARPMHWLATMMTFIMPVRVAFWFIIGFLSWIQYCTCAYAFSIGTRSRIKGNMIAAVVLLSGYAMNNVYGRGAIAEYAAASLLVSFVCALLAMVQNPARKKELLILSAIFFSLLGNIHTITTFSGTLCFFPLALYALFIYFTQQKGRWDIPVFLLASFLVLGSMAHYVYLVSVTDSMLFIQNYAGIVRLDGIDNLLLRFLPVPVNFLLYSGKPLEEVIFSSIVCQINVGLLVILAASLLCSIRRAVADKVYTKNVFGPVVLGVLLLSAALFLTWISVKSIDSSLLNAWLQRMQFPYRLLTQINILLMIGVFFLCPVLVRLKLNIPYARQMVLLLVAGPFIYMAQLFIIIPDLQTVNKSIKAVDESIPARHAGAFYGAFDYATLPAFPRLEPGTDTRRVQLVQPRRPATVLQSEPVHVAHGEVVRLDVLPFIWNHIYAVNQTTGKRERMQGQQLQASDKPLAFFVNGLPEGSYVFEAAFTPPRTWLVLRSIYLLATLMGGVSLLYLGWRWMRERNSN